MEDAKSMRALKPESAALLDDAPHLLVVDDDRRIRDLLSRFLLGEGYRVTTAESAAEARAKLAGLRFDLMILDVMMPGETGFEFARSLRTSSSVPILMLTARDEAASIAPDRSASTIRPRGINVATDKPGSPVPEAMSRCSLPSRSASA